MALPEVAAAVAPWMQLVLYVLVLGVLGYALIRRRPGRFSRPVRWPLGVGNAQLAVLSRPALFLTIVLAFCAHVISVWHEGRTVGLSVAGAIPWLDAALYVGGAQRLLFFSELDDFSSRRPLAVMYHAALQGVVNLDLRLGILLQAALLGVACYLVVRAVTDEIGPVAGLAMFAAFLGHGLVFASGTMSEAPGAIIGGIAFAVLWRGASSRVVWHAAAGLFLLAVALEVRAGPATLLLVLPAWFAWHLRGLRRFNIKAFVLLLLIALSGTLISRLAVIGFDGDPDNLYGSSAYVLYGMAQGLPGWTPAGEPLSWHRVFLDHPELYRLEEAERGPFVRARTGEQLRAHPGRLVSAYFGSARNYLVLARDRILAPLPAAWHNAIWIFAGAAATLLLARRWRLQGWAPATVDAGLLGGTVVTAGILLDHWFYSGRHQPDWFALLLVTLGFLAFGVFGSSKLERPDLTAFSVACLVGLVVSIPLLGADGIRVFGAVVPIFSLPFVLSMAVLQARTAGEDGGTQPAAEPPFGSRDLAPVLVGGGFTLLLLAGTPLAMAAVDLPQVPDRRCEDGTRAEPLFGGISLGVSEGSNERDIDRLSERGFARALAFFAPFAPSLADPDAQPPVSTIVTGVAAAGTDRIAFVAGQAGAPGKSALNLCGHTLSGAFVDNLRSVYPVPFDFFVGKPAPDDGS
jgi:hypothetical protein